MLRFWFDRWEFHPVLCFMERKSVLLLTHLQVQSADFPTAIKKIDSFE